jgi:hypothetical protein
MPVSRYANSSRLAFGTQYGTSNAIANLRSAIKNDQLSYTTIVLRGAERLDTLAGEAYGDGRYWWILAAASDIGWSLQVPPGTVINVPNLSEALNAVVTQR